VPVNLLPHDIKAKRRNPKPRSRSELAEPEPKIMVGEGGGVDRKDDEVSSKSCDYKFVEVLL
jgi:hypothetical protein